MCTTITPLGNDTYRVENFLLSMPHIIIDVRCFGNAPAIVFRHGYDGVGDKDWDRIAIEAVQTWLITGHDPSSEAAVEEAYFERVKNGFLAAAKARQWHGRHYTFHLSTYVRNWLAEEKQQVDYCLDELSIADLAKLSQYIEMEIRKPWTETAQDTKKKKAKRKQQGEPPTQLKLPL